MIINCRSPFSIFLPYIQGTGTFLKASEWFLSIFSASKIHFFNTKSWLKVRKRLSIRRMVVKELLKGINVPLGTFDAQYDIENTSVWSLGGQRIFLRKTSYLSSYFRQTSCWSKGLKKSSYFCVKKFFDLPKTMLKCFQCHIVRQKCQEVR